jgi:hypothetical protein
LVIKNHFLPEEFDMHSFTLEVEQIEGMHTSDFIRESMEKAFGRWHLDVATLSMMLRDSGANMVNACTDCEIPHFPGVGHCLHLIVGPLLVERMNKTSSIEEPNYDDDDDDADCLEEVGDDMSPDVDEIWTSEDCLDKMRSVVKDFRKADDDDADCLEEVGDDMFQDVDEIWTSEDCLDKMRSVVKDFRKATVFLRKSTKCKELLN